MEVQGGSGGFWLLNLNWGDLGEIPTYTLIQVKQEGAAPVATCLLSLAGSNLQPEPSISLPGSGSIL